jgi:hypothetical protein
VAHLLEQIIFASLAWRNPVRLFTAKPGGVLKNANRDSGAPLHFL